MLNNTIHIIRRALLCLAGVITIHGAQAQFRYVVKDTTTAYSALPSSATSLNGSTVWAGGQYTASIPFNWRMDSSIVMTDVPVDLDFPGIVESFTSSLGNGFFFASAFFVDRGSGTSSSQSPITYTTVGTTPNRIFKLQFDNAGFGDDPGLTDYVNFQFWIYETTNIIEYHFGSSSISPTEDYFGTGAGPLLGTLQNLDMTSFNTGTLYYLDGSSSPTSVDSMKAPFSTLPTNGLAAWPANGSVIRFSPRSSSCAKPAASFTATSTSALSARFTFTAPAIGLDSLKWTFGNGVAQKVTSSFSTPINYSYSTAGKYNAQVTAFNRCGATTSNASQVKVTVSDIPGLENVKVFPTVVNDAFFIEGLQAGARITLYNQAGQVVQEVAGTASRQSIDVTRLPAGVYTVQMVTDAGRGSIRVIKH